MLAKSVTQMESQTLPLIVSSGTWDLVSWSLQFLSCKMGIITPVSKIVIRIK